MKSTLFAAVGIASLNVASASFAAYGFTYTDSSNDLFDNGFANLDITSVFITDNGANLSISVTTRGFQNWTKYMMYFDTASGGTNSNAWNRPVNLTSDIEYYIGSWVDSSSNNSQLVHWTGSSWGWGSEQYMSNSVSGNTVTWTMSLASLGLSAGSVFKFDVATSGGQSSDPGIDHLSRSDAATPGWGSPSTSGMFLTYTVSPAPGAIALLGMAGLFGTRRRT